jgi:hypothetical protein
MPVFSFKNFIFINITILSVSVSYFTYLAISYDLDYTYNKNYFNNSLHNINNDTCSTNFYSSLFEKCFFKTADVVYLLVMEYFITFRYCWKYILDILLGLITRYFILLKYLICRFVQYPTSLILSTASIFILMIVRKIISDIFSYIFSRMSSH